MPFFGSISLYGALNFFSWPVFLIGSLLGVIQIGLGILIGYYLGSRWEVARKAHKSHRNRSAKEPESSLDSSLSDEDESEPVACACEDLEPLEEITDQICCLLSRVACDVHNHQNQVQEISLEIGEVFRRLPTDLENVLDGSVRSIRGANEGLQSKLAAAEEEIRHQTEEVAHFVSESRTDPLTKLPNRRTFREECGRRFSRWKRQFRRFSLVLVNVDHFSKANETYGPDMADHFLVRIGQILKEGVNKKDVVARLDEDRFGILVSEGDLQASKKIAHQLRVAVAVSAYLEAGKRYPLPSISVGLARVEPTDSEEKLIVRANEALQAAKAAGRNCEFFHDGQQVAPVMGSPESSYRTGDDMFVMVGPDLEATSPVGPAKEASP